MTPEKGPCAADGIGKSRAHRVTGRHCSRRRGSVNPHGAEAGLSESRSRRFRHGARRAARRPGARSEPAGGLPCRHLPDHAPRPCSSTVAIRHSLQCHVDMTLRMMYNAGTDHRSTGPHAHLRRRCGPCRAAPQPPVARSSTRPPFALRPLQGAADPGWPRRLGHRHRLDSMECGRRRWPLS